MDQQIDNRLSSTRELPLRVPVAEGRCLPRSLFWGLLLIGLLYLSRENYLLYHGIVELLGVAVAVTIFSIGWNSKQFVQDNSLLLLAVAYLPVAALDVLHVLSYKGMGVFPDRGPDLATQLWIAARYLESAALLWAAALLGGQRRLNPCLLLVAWLSAGALLIVLIVPLQLFPSCFVAGEGLTAFKVGSEYFISGLLGLAALVFWHKRHHLERKILLLLIASTVLTVLSELSFTLYVDVYGLSNFIGHTFKLLSIAALYLALVQGSLKSPYQSLFRTLSLELHQRQQSEEKLRTVNRELDAYLYTISHDLRSPLTPIIGFADYLRHKHRETLDSESLGFLKEIGDLGNSMSAMMDDLLTLARVGHLAAVDSPVPTEEVVDRVLLTLGSSLIEAGREVNRNPLPAARFHESLLFQLFSNLIGNALHYGAGAIEIGGERRGNQIRFSVRDHGPGIPEAERERIFELFYRGSGGNRTEGTGIGLAIIRKIARQYNGTAWAEATPGGGATFWVEMREPAVE